MQGKDLVEQNINRSRRCASIADGPNLLQNAATARMNMEDQERAYALSVSMANPPQGDYMADYQARACFVKHFSTPGGMSFGKGSILPGK